MRITKQVEVDVISAEVNDECRVDIRSARKLVDLSPDEAIAFGRELRELGFEARAAANQKLRDIADRVAARSLSEVDQVREVRAEAATRAGER